MGKHIDLTGKIYGKLKVLKYLGNSKWLCQCSCEQQNIIEVRTSQLTTGKTKSCGCLKKKYNIDDSFFEEINTEQKAYSLGFITADGSINIKNGLIKIDQKTENEDVLLKIANAMNYNNTLKHYKQCVKIGDKIYDAETSRLNISNVRMLRDIQKYGITENKSNTVKINFDLIPCELIKHFYRGIFDGDGCISFCDNKPQLSFTSSDSMIEQLVDILKQKFENIKIYKYHRHENNPNNSTMLIRNPKQVMKVLDWMYKDSNIYQDVKYKKYLKSKTLMDSRDYPITEQVDSEILSSEVPHS